MLNRTSAGWNPELLAALYAAAALEADDAHAGERHLIAQLHGITRTWPPSSTSRPAHSTESTERRAAPAAGLGRRACDGRSRTTGRVGVQSGWGVGPGWVTEQHAVELLADAAGRDPALLREAVLGRSRTRTRCP